MNSKNIKPFEILIRWQQNLNEGNLSGVMKLYDINCVVIPTFSSDILTDPEQIKKYFINVIEVQKGSVQFQHNSISEQQMGNIYLLSGKYFFYLMENEKIPARFSFLINTFHENPIMHHHSSQSIGI